MGKYFQTLRNYRESDKLRLNHCTTDAGEDLVPYIKCFTKYLDDIRATNSTLKTVFAENHKEYL